MGRLDLTLLRYLTKSDFRLLTSVEMGMKNHELVPAHLVVRISRVKGVGVHKRLRDLSEHKLLAYERGSSYDGYRLTNLGYDFLALHVLANRDALSSVGNQIGVGKESDIYLATNAEHEQLVIKLHRLGRTSFRKVKEKRDYHQSRKAASWLYLSRLAATKEFAFIKALKSAGFPVPRPIDCSRHCIVMEKVNGHPLCHVQEVKDTAHLYDSLMSLIVRLGNAGLIHGDLNEFNVMIDVDTEEAVLIDFPQMMSTSHLNAETYFERDVRCVREFFKRRFDYESELAPTFADIETDSRNLDAEVSATGFTAEMRKEWKKHGGQRVGVDDDEEDDDDESDTSTIVSGDEVEELESDPSEDGDLDGEGEQVDDDDGEDAKIAQLMTVKASHLTAWMSKLKTPAGEVDDEHVPQLVVAADDGAADVEDDQRFESVSTRGGAKVGTASTTASTIPPDEVRRRVRAQHYGRAHATAAKVKVKGQANAVRRGRKDNSATVGDYSGWDLS